MSSARLSVISPGTIRGLLNVRVDAVARRKVEVIPYSEFRTGLTYREVYYVIWGRRWKRRHGVLGKWRELKQAMYAEYLEGVAQCRK